MDARSDMRNLQKGGREVIFIDLPLALSPVKYILAPLVGGMGGVLCEQPKRKIKNIVGKYFINIDSLDIVSLQITLIPSLALSPSPQQGEGGVKERKEGKWYALIITQRVVVCQAENSFTIKNP